MKLLIFTQKVDMDDTVLGFFHGWLIALSRGFESITVICLEEGRHELPKNIIVHSLGKETKKGRFGYIRQLYRYLSVIAGTYDAVFVHMNQEYVLLAGLYWKLKRIPVYLWRNHPRGSLCTRIAVALSTKVFCTSNQSFTAHYAKTVIMPAGIDTDFFTPVPSVVRKKYSVCMVGRVAPIKHIELMLEAMTILMSKNAQVTCSIIGKVEEKDIFYFDGLKKYVEDNSLSTVVHFSDGVALEMLPEILSGHEICVNLTEKGSFDKTIVESASCGAVPLVSNISLKDMLPSMCVTSNDPHQIADSIQTLLVPTEQIHIQKELDTFVASQSLKIFIEKLKVEMHA